MFEAILEDLREFNRIIIHRHGRPDGDAIGSQVGLKYIIKEKLKKKKSKKEKKNKIKRKTLNEIAGIWLPKENKSQKRI